MTIDTKQICPHCGALIVKKRLICWLCEKSVWTGEQPPSLKKTSPPISTEGNSEEKAIDSVSVEPIDWPSSETNEQKSVEFSGILQIINFLVLPIGFFGFGHPLYAIIITLLITPLIFAVITKRRDVDTFQSTGWSTFFDALKIIGKIAGVLFFLGMAFCFYLLYEFLEFFGTCMSRVGRY